MKKTSLKMLMVGLVAAVAFLLAGVNEAQAQTDQQVGEFYTVPASNWVTNGEAVNLLNNKITEIKTVLDTQTPGTPAHGETLRAGVFYRTILTDLQANEVIPDAIFAGLTTFTVTQYGGASLAQKVALRTESIELLSN